MQIEQPTTEQLTTEQPRIEEKEINFLDICVTLLKRKRLIMGGTMAIAVLTLICAFVMTPIYEATSTLMPPSSNGSSAATQLLGQLGGAASLILGGGAGAGSGDLYVGIIKNPVVLDAIIKQFNLKELYKTDTIEGARKILSDEMLTAVVDSKSGITSVAVDDVNPQRAAAMANAFVQQLKNVLDKIAVTDSSRKRLFFEGQLKKTHETLSQSEDALRKFQERTGVLKMDDQASATLQGIVTLGAQIAAKEVQLKVIKTFATSNNFDLKRATQELEGLKNELSKLEAKQDTDTPSVIIKTGQMPELGIEYIRTLRDFKYNETLYELIVKQYEAARLEESNQAAIVQVISEATVPERKAKPKLFLMLVIAITGGICLFTGAAFVLDYFEKASDDSETEESIGMFKKHLTRF